MKLFGYEIKKEDPREIHGRVIYNIQVRERGISLAGPDGISEINPSTINPRAHLLGFVYLERFVEDWGKVAILTDKEVELWVSTTKNFEAHKDSQPVYHALQEVLKARTNDRNRDVS